MASLNEIKTKIASTKKTSHITGAMQMVSAAKLQKSENSARKYQIYAEKVREVTLDLIAHASEHDDNPLLNQRPIKRTGYLVITSDRGLVGSYNSSILKPVMADLQKKHDEDNYESTILAIGGMGIDFFKHQGIEVEYEVRDVEDDIDFEQVREIVSKAIELYLAEKFDELYVCYNHHVNSLTSTVRMEKMLPVVVEDSDLKESKNFSFELEPNHEEIMKQLIPQFAESMIYGAIVDAKSAEHAAGMSAMRTATDNAKNVINDLTIQYNRARQAAITQEITEIVAGASAI